MNKKCREEKINTGAWCSYSKSKDYFDEDYFDYYHKNNSSFQVCNNDIPGLATQTHNEPAFSSQEPDLLEPHSRVDGAWNLAKSLSEN